MRTLNSFSLALVIALSAACGKASDSSVVANAQPSVAANSVKTAAILGPQLAMTGNLRVYQSGNQKGLQLDVRNLGNGIAYGPRLAVNLEGVAFAGNQSLYPYWGGNVSQANSVFPGELGYIMVKIPQGTPLNIGQHIHVTVQTFGGTNFSDFSGDVVACQKGLAGCE